MGLETIYDLAVIGAGPGGQEAALRAAGAGKKVAVIESGELGGTCLNRGCIPTKALMHAARLYREASEGSSVGIRATDIQYDFEAMHQRKDEIVSRLRKGIDFLFRNGGVDLYKGTARILAPGMVRLLKDDGLTDILAKNILIATGGRPSIPAIDGAGALGVMTSDTLLDWRGQSPASLVIIGGGVIGLEFASLFADLGCRVTVVEAMDRLLPQLDAELGQAAAAMLKKKKVAIHTTARVERIEQAEGGLRCLFDAKGKKQEALAERLLIAVGRRPNTEGLFEDGAAPDMRQGALVVDRDFRTSIPGIYAVGDVIGGIQLAHLASAQGAAAVSRMFGLPERVDLDTVPSCVYLDPEIASVGLSLDEAAAAGYPAKAAKYQMISNARALIDGHERGFVRIIYDARDGRILGGQIVSGRATDMIPELTAAVGRKLTLGQMAATMRPHPTCAEGVSKALEAALEDLAR